MRCRRYPGIALVSAATLMFELALTRIFAVAEWYHFAFLSISVALLGYASSGTVLSLLPLRWRPRLVFSMALAYPWLILGAYGVINTVPLDSYQLAWDRRQMLYLLVYYLGLVLPFVVSGFLVGHYLALQPERSNAIYAANLIGSALGALGLLGVLPWLGGEGSVAGAAALGALGALLLLTEQRGGGWLGHSRALLAGGTLVLCGALAGLRPTWMTVRMSPYKSLSYALRAADARLTYRRWSLQGRVDVVESTTVHSSPGLSLRFSGKLPVQHGLTVDGDNLNALSRRQTVQDTAFLTYLPSSIPYQLRPGAKVLILQPGGGLDVAVALQMGARNIEAVEPNPLVAQVLRDLYGEHLGQLYGDPRVSLRIEDARSALRGSGAYDVVQFSLWEGFHPLASGAYSLSENHLYTVEAMREALAHLREGGILVVTRWLQNPPSESLRAAATLVTALERWGIVRAADHLVAYRTWSTMTLLASPSPFAAADLELVRDRCAALGYDVVYYPGIHVEETNRYNVLPRPVYYEAIAALLGGPDRKAFYGAQFYDVSPPTDNRPFFGHFFRWRQVPSILAQMGRTWQPFGGSGFLLVWALLFIALVAAALLVLLPLAWRRYGQWDPPQQLPSKGRGGLMRWSLLYFVGLGLGFILVEMPLLQQFILYLGQPTVAFTVVLTALLAFSGLGSLWAPRVRPRLALVVLVGIVVVYPWLLRALFDATIGMPIAARMGIAIASLVPLGLLMGMPFVAGLQTIERCMHGLTPWIWAVNGSASVVGSIVAALLALSWGYRLVLWVAAFCYAISAWAMHMLARPTDRMAP